MKIPLNAQVECTDGVYGRSEYVLINPVTDQVTHLVVKQDISPNFAFDAQIERTVKALEINNIHAIVTENGAAGALPRNLLRSDLDRIRNSGMMLRKMP